MGHKRLKAMKILFSARKLDPPSGGAEISAMEILRELAKNNDVTALTTGNNKEYKKDNIKIKKVRENFISSISISWAKRYFLNLYWRKILDNYLKKNDFDLIITQLDLTPSTVEIANKYRIPSIVFIRSYEHFYLNLRFSQAPKKMGLIEEFLSAPLKYKVQFFPFYLLMKKWNERSIKTATKVIANSEFTAEVCEMLYGVKAEVIYPPIRVDKYLAKKRKADYVTIIRPTIPKGGELFIKIADALPDVRFLAVGNAEKHIVGELKRRKNVTYMPWTDNMKEDVYSKTKILLIPSLWHEPFGRMAVEAMINGIPCIVSNKGGTPHIVNGAGIIVDNVNDINAWVKSIERLITDKKEYKRLSKRAKERARHFDYNTQMTKIKNIMKEIYNERDI